MGASPLLAQRSKALSRARCFMEKRAWRGAARGQGLRREFLELWCGVKRDWGRGSQSPAGPGL